VLQPDPMDIKAADDAVINCPQQGTEKVFKFFIALLGTLFTPMSTVSQVYLD